MLLRVQTASFENKNALIFYSQPSALTITARLIARAVYVFADLMCVILVVIRVFTHDIVLHSPSFRGCL